MSLRTSLVIMRPIKFVLKSLPTWNHTDCKTCSILKRNRWWTLPSACILCKNAEVNFYFFLSNLTAKTVTTDYENNFFIRYKLFLRYRSYAIVLFQITLFLGHEVWKTNFITNIVTIWPTDRIPDSDAAHQKQEPCWSYMCLIFITMIMVNISCVLCCYIGCFLEQVFQKTWVLSIEGWASV